jgi:tetratricopeptide (TPR) repeat protein
MKKIRLIVLTPTLTTSAKIKADDVYSKALFYYFEDNCEKALPLFQQYLQTHPDPSSDAWFYAGVCYGDLGLHQKAIQAYKQAIRLEPDYAEAHNNLGVTYINLGFHQEALQACKQVIKLEPDYAMAHYNLGVAYSKLGLYRDALQALKQAIRLKPDYAKAHYSLGVAYSKLGLYRDALQALKQAIRLKPDYAKAHYSLGVAYGNLGLYQEALQANKQAIRLKPDYAKAHYNLGISYFAKGDTGSALEEYNILKNLDAELANELFKVVISYDDCSSDMGKMCGLVKKNHGSIEKVRDLTQKASSETKNLFRSIQREPARDVAKHPLEETRVKEVFPELPMEVEETIETPLPPVKTAEPRTAHLKTIEVSESSEPVDIKHIDEENLKKMVKPQLISLCKNLNIECDYTETKTQIIAKILEQQRS